MSTLQPMARETLFVTNYRGQDWNGTWRVENGRVFVNSAYGSSNADVVGMAKQPEVLAERLLREQVDAWRTRRS